MQRRTHRARLTLMAAIAAALAAPAWSQAYPARPIRVITQFNAGTPGDLIARVAAQVMSETMGQPGVVENRPGGGGIVAVGAVVRAAPDGYTLLVSNASVPAVLPVLAKNPLPFDPLKDLTPITIIGDIAMLVVANAALPFNNFKELIEYARANPGKVNYGTTGIGTSMHLAGEQIDMLSGAPLTHIPYKTSPVLDAASGALQLAFVVGAQGLPLIREGKVKLITVMSSARFRAMPEVPLINEVLPGFEPPPQWTGLLGPGALPPAIVKRLFADVVHGLTSPEGRARVQKVGFESMVSKSPEEFAALIRRQQELVARIAKSAGIPKLD
ncbi:MAG: tripartite tricarboxylate transporter substrate binding protein [Burkholderiales bacterium]|nr:tripartite tricarboxylate transporter substrate binding protein [Burkholderiales bacterium]